MQNGCDNFCTYCAIPYIRGRYESRKFEDIIEEAKQLADNGIEEVILIAQAKEEAINVIIEIDEYKKKKCKTHVAKGCLVKK